MQRPLVSIGIPVYNGEAYIGEAIQSVLNQTFADFELLISDNASTDGTQAICNSFAKDERIRYIRQPANIGAGPNFNALVAPCKGTYFKWLAHDDAIAGDFLERCIATLERDPAAVLCSPPVSFIGPAGEKLGEYVSPFPTDDPNPAVRFFGMLQGHPCFEVFGLIRMDSLRKTELIGNYNHGDGVLLAHLALMGVFAKCPDSLMYSRRHDRQSMAMFGITNEKAPRDFEAYAAWFDPRNRPGLSRSFNRAFYAYLRMIKSTPLSISQRAAIYSDLVRWLFPRWRILAGEWKRTAYHALGFETHRRAAERTP